MARTASFYILWTGSFLTLLLLSVYHYKLVTDSNPLEYREAAALVTTDLILHGQNPYSLSQEPAQLDEYGFVYNFVAAPVVLLLHNPLIAHRLVSAVSLIAVCLFLAGVMRRFRVSGEYVLALIVILYASLLFGVTPVARPDAIGLLLFLLAVFIPWLYGYSYRTLHLAGALSLLAFYTKPYFLFAAPLVFVYVFVFVSRKKSFAFLLSFTTQAILSVIAVTFVFRDYFYDTVLNHYNLRSYVRSHVLLQLKSLFTYEIGPLVLLLLILIAARKVRWRREVALPVMLTLLSFAVVTLQLAGHLGAYMSYYNQLYLPFFVLWVGIVLTENEFIPRSVVAVLIVMNFWSAYIFKGNLNYGIADQEAWSQVRKEVASHRKVLNSPATAEILFEQKKTVYDSGLSQYLSASVAKGWLKKIFPLSDEISARNDEYLRNIESSIRCQEFDLILLPQNGTWLASQELLEKYYTPTREFALVMPHMRQKWNTLDWVPRAQALDPACRK